jgi:hypothetical protein
VSTKDGIVEQDVLIEQHVSTVKSENGVAKQNAY